MKKLTCILCSLLALSFLPALCQEGQPPPLNRPFLRGTPQGSTDQPKLTTFNLDFPGGTPADLVKAIETAVGKPMNVIIPTDDADTQLPPLKMNGVDVPHLFAALGSASTKMVLVPQPYGSYNQYETSYGFQTSDNPVTDSSIWHFNVNKPALVPSRSICKFYPLQPYLNYGFTVDDITTAIQTGWKMAGITSPPELNYHKETNLLIACGNLDDLETIQKVLDSLPKVSMDKSQLDYLFKETYKFREFESQLDKLNKKVSALTTNSPASDEKNSGK